MQKQMPKNGRDVKNEGKMPPKRGDAKLGNKFAEKCKNARKSDKTCRGEHVKMQKIKAKVCKNKQKNLKNV